jgi:hypothetical protein
VGACSAVLGGLPSLRRGRGRGALSDGSGVREGMGS